MSHFKNYSKAYFLVFLLLVNIGVLSALNYQTKTGLRVSFLDVGQGEAIFVKAPNGRQMLVDGGPNGNVLRELGKVMPFYDRSIDVLVATHADEDHIGGLVAVLKRFQVDLLVRSNTTSTSAVYQELEALVKEKKIKEEIILKPEILTLGAGTDFDILFPVQNTAGWETNDASIVGKLVYGHNSFLLTGDAPQKIEKYLVTQYGAFLKSDVLKVGHHGSKNSSAEIFISAVSPTYSVISAGLNNRFGHPAPETLKTLGKFTEKILQTLGGGSILFEADGQGVSVI